MKRPLKYVPLTPLRIFVFATIIVIDAGFSGSNRSTVAYAGPKPSIQTTSTQDIVARMQKLYRHTRALTGKFTQTYRDLIYARTRVSRGSFAIKPPQRARWDYDFPEKKGFITDGKTLWVWEPSENQVFKNSLNKDRLSTAFSFLLGKGDLNKSFTMTPGVLPEAANVTRSKDFLTKHHIVKAVPKTPTAQYDYLLFVIRKSDGAVLESTMVTAYSTNRFAFSKLKFNAKISNKIFRFTPPTGSNIRSQ